jgi:hypothetical protein
MVPKRFVCWARNCYENVCFPFDPLTLSVALGYRQTLPLQLQHEKKLYFSSLEKQDLMKTFFVLLCLIPVFFSALLPKFENHQLSIWTENRDKDTQSLFE